MGKTVRHGNYRVEVEPDEPLFWGKKTESQMHGKWYGECERIRDEIKRHVDNLGSIAILYDDITVCEFCGEEWEDDPACCKQAMDEWAAQHPEEVPADAQTRT